MYDRNRLRTNYFHAKTIASLTTINHNNASTIIDIFCFFLKKALIERKLVRFFHFGVFVLRKKRYTKIKFYNSRFVGDILNHTLNNTLEIFHETSLTKEHRFIIKQVASSLKMKFNDARYIISIFLYSIVEECLQEEHSKIKRFGTFTRKLKIIYYKMSFEPYYDFMCELANPNGAVTIGKRAANILKILGHQVNATKHRDEYE